MMMEVDGARLKGRLRKTWWHCIAEDMWSLGLFQDDVRESERERERERERGQTETETETVKSFPSLMAP